jgi:squalene-associated FAD-dependent desaturase
MPDAPMLNAAEDRVVVVGGGLAGMAAALALTQHGVKVTLLESRRRLGGRTGSFTVSSNADGNGSRDETVDYCQHVAMGCCTNLRQFVAWLGQSEHWLEYKELHFLSSRGDYHRLRPLPILPAPLHIGHWLLRWPNLSLLDRLAVARGLLAIWRLRWNDDLDRIPALQWLVQHGQTAGSLKHFWSTIMVSALGAELDAVNLAAAAKVIQDGFLNHRHAFHVLVPQRSLDELFNQQAQQQLRQAGVQVELATQVKRISQTFATETAWGDTSESPAPLGLPGQSNACQPQIEILTGRGSFHATACIVAVPWHALGRLAADSNISGLAEIARQADALDSSPITGIHTWWDRPWMQLPHVAIVGRLCQWVFAPPADLQARHKPCGTSTASGLDAQPGHYYQIVISASHQLSASRSAELQQQVVEELNELFPESRLARLLQFKVVTDPQAVFSIAPGTSALRPLAAPLGPHVLLAGDWTRTGWPATMEGAVLSGFRAAETFLASRGSRATIVAAPLGGGPKATPSTIKRELRQKKQLPSSRVGS